MTLLMTIKTAAAEAALTPETLREYERLGLISPQRNSAGQRLYTPLDVEQARRIAKQRAAACGRGLRTLRGVATA